MRICYIKKWSVAMLIGLITCLLSLCACADDGQNMQDAEIVTFNVAIVANMNEAQATENRRVVEWCKENIEKYQDGLKKRVRLNIEWYDENQLDYAKLCETLASREDLLTVISMSSSDKNETMAYKCAQTKKNLILPTASSAELVRKYCNQMFMWTLVETDVTQCEILLSKAQKNKAHSVSLLACDGLYGATFKDWFAFQATELKLKIGTIETYRDTTEFKDITARMEDDTYVICAMNSPEEIPALYRNSKPGLNFIFTDSSFDPKILEIDINRDINGISYYSDPESGFKIAYERRFSSKPFGTSAHLYDAVMLVGYGASYIAHNRVTNMNEALSELTDCDEHANMSMWEGLGMNFIFNDIEHGSYTKLQLMGASGKLEFDSIVHTCVVNSTFCDWELSTNWKNGQRQLYINDYISSNGSHRTASSLSSWNWDVYWNEPDMEHPNLPHPECQDMWALVVASSTGWSNYRHQADALRMYQTLKHNGFDDEHIILIINDDLAHNEHNPKPGVLIAPDNSNIYDNVKVDYRTTDLTIKDLEDILNGRRSERLPDVISSDSSSNVLVFWSGHGRSSGELCWHDLYHGISAETMRNMVKDAADNMRYRKMLWFVEACYSEAVMKGIEGLPNVMAFTAANSNEESKADVYSFEYKTYLTNRFTSTLLDVYANNPLTTLRDFYYYLSRATIASHVCLINEEQNDNIFQTFLYEYVHYNWYK